jgi:hypothetical protein
MDKKREIGRESMSQLRICSWGSEDAGQPSTLALVPDHLSPCAVSTEGVFHPSLIEFLLSRLCQVPDSPMQWVGTQNAFL